MRALTLWQPWASAIAHLDKRVENRTWRPPQWTIGETIAIHAGKSLDREALEDLAHDGELEQLGDPIPRGAIVATAQVVGWVRDDGRLLDRRPVRWDGISEDRAAELVAGRWWAGPFGWVLDDVVSIEPVPCRGRQGLWTVPEELLPTLRRRWRFAQEVRHG
jgi:hypothetical protein